MSTLRSLKTPSVKHYFKPTPKNLQKFADGLVALSLSATGYAVIMDNKWTALVFIAIGAIGAFGQKFFCDDSE